MKVYYKILIFSLCFLYWGYLTASSEMDIAMDAANYQSIGENILRKGWKEGYFQGGPNREPLYPWLISLSMRTAQQFSINYTSVQKFIQILFLLATQVLALIILQKLNVREWLRWAVILYMGFSPSLVNAALSLYSEIASLPLILGIILLSLSAWKAIRTGKLFLAVMFAVGESALFLAATGVKGIFQYIFVAFMVAFLVLGLIVLRRRKMSLVSLIGFCAVFFVLYQSVLVSFKSLNKQYNGQFVYTNRFDAMLYGNAVKRARPLTKDIFWSHIASIPGEGVCRKFFSASQCRYCTFLEADDIYGFGLPKLIQDIPVKDRSAKIIALTKEAVQSNPGNYLFFMAIEGLRMFFWESAHLGFVRYPTELKAVYDSPLVSDGLRLLVSVITIAAYAWLIVYIVRGVRKLPAARMNALEEDTYVMCLFIFILTFVYIGGYSLYSTLTRFSLPIAPLFLILIALAASKRGNFR